MYQQPTLSQIAKKVGVATSTASRAFNEPHRLKSETVAKIHQVAEEMGYLPNKYARALSTGRTATIGLIVADIVNPFFPPLVRAAQRQAGEKDISVHVVETNSDPKVERQHIRSLLHQCEGLIIASPRLPPSQLRPLISQDRVVLINSDIQGTARVLISSSEPLREGLQLMYEQGCRRFCYCGGPHLSWSQKERSGVLRDLKRDYLVHVSYLTVDSGTYQEARALAVRAAATHPDCIVAYDDIIAYGLLDGLRRLKIRVPEDVRIIGCDDALPMQTYPNLSTIALEIERGGETAVDMIIGCKEPTLKSSRRVFPGKLILRETT